MCAAGFVAFAVVKQGHFCPPIKLSFMGSRVFPKYVPGKRADFERRVSYE